MPEMISTDRLAREKISPQEYKEIQALLERDPNDLELALFGVMWSEHCSYKNSKLLLGKLPKTGSRTKVLAGPGENAGVVELRCGAKIAFKIESHNRPTAIEPFQGATTGVGGIIRDILALGARPIALFNSLHFGPDSDEKSNYLLREAVRGIAHYGNCAGVPTLGGQIIRHERYKKMPLMNAMCVGLLETENVLPSATSVIGAPIVYLGSATGRDGLGGASFASAGLSGSSEQDRPAVQIGDPFAGKLLIEATLEILKSGFVLASQDMGAAGLICASSEMSAKGNVGVEIDLDLVPQRGKLTPREILLSESQERMLFILEPGSEPSILELASKWGLEARVIGVTAAHGKLKISAGSDLLSDLPPKALTEQCPLYTRSGKAPLPLISAASNPESSPSAWIYEQFDQSVQLASVFLPGQADAAVIRLKGSKNGSAIAVTVDALPELVNENPYWGMQRTLAESLRNLACVGASPVALTNNLNFGNPEKPQAFYYLEQSILGLADACKLLDLPVVSGNVSLYNEYQGQEQVLPTPVLGLLGEILDVSKARGQHFQAAGDKIWLFSAKAKAQDPALPDFAVDWDFERALTDCLLMLFDRELVSSAHDIGPEGFLAALEECLAPESSLGATLNIKSSELGAIILSARPDHDLSSFAGDLLQISEIGRVKLEIKGNDKVELLSAF